MSSALLDTDGVFGMGRKGGEKGTKICLILYSINRYLSCKASKPKIFDKYYLRTPHHITQGDRQRVRRRILDLL
jgi:hypothetical protein